MNVRKLASTQNLKRATKWSDVKCQSRCVTKYSLNSRRDFADDHFVSAAEVIIN